MVEGKAPLFAKNPQAVKIAGPDQGTLDQTSKANSIETQTAEPDGSGVTNQPSNDDRDGNLPQDRDDPRLRPPVEGTDEVRDPSEDVEVEENSQDPFGLDSAARQGLSPEEADVYTSTPVARFQLGRFRFDNATLRLIDEDDKAEFKEILEKASPRDKALVKKLDVQAANEMVRNRIQQSNISKQFDSSVGRDSVERLVGNSPLVGATEVFTMGAQMDHNRPVEGTNVVNDTPAAAAITKGAVELQEPNEKGQVGEKPGSE